MPGKEDGAERSDDLLKKSYYKVKEKEEDFLS